MTHPSDFNYLSPEVQREPAAYFAAMRAQAPVYREPHTGAFFLSRAADLREAASRPEVFSNEIDPTVFRVCQGLSLRTLDPAVAQLLESKARLTPFTLLMTDPPQHGRYRRLAMEALSAKAVADLQPLIHRQVAHFIKVFDSVEPVDFLAEFAEKVPLSIILHFAGAPESDIPLVSGWTHQFFSTLMGQSSREEYLRTVETVCELYQYVARRIQSVRTAPDDSLLSRLVHAHEATGDAPLTLEETLSIFQVLLLAGHDTTRQTLTNAMRVLATNPELYPRLAINRSLVKPFIDEVIRLYSPANVTARRAVCDTYLGGKLIPAGATVFLCWGSGNRDDAEWERPEEFHCPRTAGGSHLGFGYGIHLCVGMRLAKAQLSATIESFLDRYEAVELAVSEERLEYTAAINLRSLTMLPIRCRGRQAK